MSRWLLLAGSVGLLACGGAGQDLPPAQAPAKAAATGGFAGNGTWWNPAEPGTGLMFEAQGGTGVLALFLFETTGRPVWYMAVGKVTLSASGRTVFSGQLQRYRGGRPISSASTVAPIGTVVGAVQVAFDGDVAQVQLPQRAFTAHKFYRATQVRPATPTQPETGVYWNPAESGRGYTVEVNDNVATIGVFHYDEAGEPVWNLVVGNIASGAFEAPLQAYADGQGLAGAYRPAVSRPAPGQLGVAFSDPCAGALTIAGRGTVAIRRFPFGTLGAGRECRAKPDLSLVAQSALGGVTLINDLRLATLSPVQVTADIMLGQAMPDIPVGISITGEDAALAGKSYYAIVEDPDSLLQSVDQPQVIGGNGRSLPMQLRARPLLTPGERQGDLRIFVCTDPACRQQLTGSPLALPYRVNVRAIQTGKEALVFNSSTTQQPPQVQSLPLTMPKGAISFTARLKTPGGTVSSDAPPVSQNFPAPFDTPVNVVVNFPSSLATGLVANALVVTFRFRVPTGVDEWVKEVPVYRDNTSPAGAGYVLLPGSEVPVQLRQGSLATATLEPSVALPAGATAVAGAWEYTGYPPVAEGHPLARDWLSQPSQVPPYRVSACNVSGVCLPAGRYVAQLPFTITRPAGTETVHQVLVLDVAP